MARMIPNIDPGEIPFESERILYAALRDHLSEEFVCFHSYPWLRPDRDLVLREGEADFIVLHQQRGMLVLEAKGGDISYQAPLWKRRRNGGWETIQDPFRQAQRSMHKLNDIVEERCDGDVLTKDYVFVFAAAFPTHDYLGPVPSNSDPVIIIARSDLETLQEKIDTTFRRWTKQQKPLNNSQWAKLINALLPCFKLFRPITATLHADYEHIKELTDGQVAFFQSVYGATRVYVEGVAGSGKTLLAMDRARAFAKAKKKTLLVCYNKQLAIWWSEQFANSEADRDCLQYLDIFHFHSLASHIARQAGMPFASPNSPNLGQTFWREEVPSIIEQASLILVDDPGFQYDAIVLDEGQDFHPAWWDCLNYCLLKNENKGIFYAFSDPDQSLWEWATAKPDISFTTPIALGKNCRNTRAIARSSSKMANLQTDVMERSPIGLKPQISRAPNVNAGKGILLQSVIELMGKHHVLPEDLVLLGSSNYENGSLATLKQIDNIPLTDSAVRWRQGGEILVTTSRSFKGLEADAVIVYDIGEIGGGFNLTDLYVACTRARAYLHLIVHDAKSATLIQQAIEHGWLQASGASDV